MDDRLVLIGTKGGPAIRPGGPSPTAHLLVAGGRPIVVDCGLGVTRGVVEAGVGLKALDLVFVTHHHSDHVLEFGALVHTAWTAGLATPVRAFGPPGLTRVWEGFLASQAFDVATRIADEGRPDLAGLVRIVEYGEGPVHEEPGLRVTALRNVHPPVTESFALRFDTPAWSVVFSGDTAFFPPLADFARGADLLVHEALFGPGVDRLVARVGNGATLKAHLLASHTLAEDVGRIATRAGVGRLVLNHLVPADDPEVRAEHWEAAVRTTWAGSLTVGRDGLVLPLGRG